MVNVKENIIQDLSDNNHILLYLTVSDNRIYGFDDVEEEDYKYKGVFITPLDDVLNGKNTNKINGKNYVLYELSYFLENHNPRVKEILYVEPKFVIYQHKLFYETLSHKYHLFTRTVVNRWLSISGKLIDYWEKSVKKRLDFIYKDRSDFVKVKHNDNLIPLKKWMSINNYHFKHLNVVPIGNVNENLFINIYMNVEGNKYHKWYNKLLRKITKKELVDENNLNYVRGSNTDDNKKYLTSGIWDETNWSMYKKYKKRYDKDREYEYNVYHIMNAIRVTEMIIRWCDTNKINLVDHDVSFLKSILNGEFDIEKLRTIYLGNLNKIESKLKKMEIIDYVDDIVKKISYETRSKYYQLTNIEDDEFGS